MIEDAVSLWPYAAGLVLAVFVLGAIGLFLGNRRYTFVSGRIEGVVGELGGGKSMFVVSRVLRPACKAMSTRRGLRCAHSGRPVRQIITNFTFDPAVLGYPNVKVVQITPVDGLSLWQQIIAQGEVVRDPVTGEYDLRLDAIIGIDEFGLFAPSDAPKFDPLAKACMQHFRKWNAELYWMTAPDVMSVHKRARMFTRRVWNCGEARRGWASFMPIRMFVADAHKRDETGGLGEVVDRMVYPMRKRVVRAYRSYETIAASADDLRAIEAAMTAAGLVAGESRRNDLSALARRATRTSEVSTGQPTVVGKNANGPHAQISTPESATRSSSDDERSATRT